MSQVPAVRRPVPVPAGADPASLTFGEMLRRAEVLAKTDLVPKPLQNKPEAIVVIGVWGAEHGVPLMTAIQEVHVIENRPSPSAQLRLALIRRAGHEVAFVETTPERAVIRGRRREYRDDPDRWVTVEYTLAMARQAGLLDEWVERWARPPGAKYDKKETWRVGDDQGTTAAPAGAPGWVAEEIAAGRIHSKDNWRKYPADMLRARAASVLARMEFSDVMAALGADQYTPEEHGVDIGQDLDEPATVEDPPDGDDGGEVDEAVVVEDLTPGPEGQPSAHAHPPAPDEAPQAGERPPGEAGPTPACGQTPAAQRVAPIPAPKPGERLDVAALKARIQTLDTEARASLATWLAACGIPDSIDVSEAKVAAVEAELDRRGVPKITTSGHDRPPETDG